MRELTTQEIETVAGAVFFPSGVFNAISVPNLNFFIFPQSPIFSFNPVSLVVNGSPTAIA